MRMPRMAVMAWMTAGAAVIGVCILAGPTAGHPGGLTEPVFALLAGGGGVFAAILGWRLHRHAQLARQLSAHARPVWRDGIEVHELEGLEAAFVAGVRRPRIFCAPDLPRRLAPDELRAVLHHERFHQLDRAPAKLVALHVLAPLLRHVPSGRSWIAGQFAKLEIAADRYALAAGVSRRSLARALLALAPSPDGMGAGFTTAAELRLRALLEPEVEPGGFHPLGWLAPPLTAAICLLLFL